MKKINRICRKGAGWEERLAAAGITMTEREQKVLADVARFQSYYIKNGCPTFPPYALSNLGSNIRRLKDRLAAIEAKGESNGNTGQS